MNRNIGTLQPRIYLLLQMVTYRMSLIHTGTIGHDQVKVYVTPVSNLTGTQFAEA